MSDNHPISDGIDSQLNTIDSVLASHRLLSASASSVVLGNEPGEDSYDSSGTGLETVSRVEATNGDGFPVSTEVVPR